MKSKYVAGTFYPQLILLFCSGGPDQLKKKCPSLFKLRRSERILELVRNLPQIIELQEFIKTNFDYKLDVNAINKLSVDTFIQKHWPKHGQKEWNERIGQYLELLDHVKSFIFEVGIWGPKAKSALGKKRISREMNCTVLFPNPHGLGPFAIGLVQLLIETHNNIVSDTKRHEIQLRDLLEENDHLITFNADDVNLLILANSSYELEVKGKGQITEWKLNESALETMINEK